MARPVTAATTQQKRREDDFRFLRWSLTTDYCFINPGPLGTRINVIPHRYWRRLVQAGVEWLAAERQMTLLCVVDMVAVLTGGVFFLLFDAV